VLANRAAMPQPRHRKWLTKGIENRRVATNRVETRGSQHVAPLPLEIT